MVYDDSDIRSAARAWWMLRYFGHANVSLLDGGFAAWRKAGGETQSGAAATPPKGTFSARSRDGAGVIAMEEMVAKINQGTVGQILDARAAARFAGEAPEPRKGLRAGHIPGSRNLPFDQLLDDKGRYRDPQEIKRLFTEAGIDTAEPVITSCGSGITACVLALALERVGNKDAFVYDGSWTEYGAGDAPIESTPGQLSEREGGITVVKAGLT